MYGLIFAKFWFNTESTGRFHCVHGTIIYVCTSEANQYLIANFYWTNLAFVKNNCSTRYSPGLEQISIKFSIKIEFPCNEIVMKIEAYWNREMQIHWTIFRPNVNLCTSEFTPLDLYVITFSPNVAVSHLRHLSFVTTLSFQNWIFERILYYEKI